MINFLRIHLLPLGMQRDKRPSGLHSNLHRIHFWNILYTSFDNNKFNFNVFNKFIFNIFCSIVFSNIYFQFQESLLKFSQTFGDGWFRHNWWKVFLVKWSLEKKDFFTLFDFSLRIFWNLGYGWLLDINIKKNHQRL